MTSIEIEPSDVIRLLQQYLKENRLFKTLKTLQEETSINLNTVDSIETFVNDINSGHWDVVLKAVKILKLPDSKLIDLYEQIAIELIELRETRAANWLIHKAEPMLKLKQTSPDRYVHLQNLLGRPFFDYKEAYRKGSSREGRRNDIAKCLMKEVNVVPPQRLLTLIGDALKWQKHEGLLPSGSSIDIFTGKAHMVHAEEETYPNVLHKHCITPIKPDKSDTSPPFVSCSEFSPDGHYLVVGYDDGLIEVRKSSTGVLEKNLKFQSPSQENYIVTPNRTQPLSLCFSATELLAIGDKGGDISIWKLETGQLVSLFKQAHTKSVNCLVFHKNGKEILSGSNDETVKLHGMRSNKIIRDFIGHKAYVKGVAFSRDYNFVISGGFDSTVRIWNAKTAQMIREYKSMCKVSSLSLMPYFKSDIFLIGTTSRSIHLIDLEGKLRAKLCDEAEEDRKPENSGLKKANNEEQGKEIKKPPGRFYAICSSPKGNYVYAVDSKHLVCFSYSTKKVVKKIVVHEESENLLIGVIHHPFRNLVGTHDMAGNFKLWKP